MMSASWEVMTGSRSRTNILAKSDKRYIPSYKRANQPPPMQLTERDIQIVLAVYEYRLLSAHQLEALFFSSNSNKSHSRRSACQRRLQLLYHHGFLERLPQPVSLGQGRAPFVYALDGVGANLVATQLGIDRAEVGWKPKHNQLGPQFMDHSLVINDLRVVIQRLVEKDVLEVDQWVDEFTLKSTEMQQKVPYLVHRTRTVRKYPDGYFILRQSGSEQQAHFFLEVDMGTMSNARWQEKVKAYAEFRQSGQSQRHYGTRNFRVLAVTTSEQRLNNLKRATEQARGNRYFWFTTQAAVNIWQPETLMDTVWSVATKDERQQLFKM